jgi:hypothetical protein
LSHPKYEVRDLECDRLGQSNVDLIFAHSAVHHISRLEALFDSVHSALRPGGIFHLNERRSGSVPVDRKGSWQKLTISCGIFPDGN